VNAEVEVVLLGREVREVILTSVEVQSDKAEGTLVMLPIHTDVLTSHEAHVGVEEKGAGTWSSAYPRPLNIGYAHKAIEIRDSGRFLPWAKELHVKGAEWQGQRDRPGVGGNRRCRVYQFWHPQR
jgi:hypothetical protein